MEREKRIFARVWINCVFKDHKGIIVSVSMASAIVPALLNYNNSTYHITQLLSKEHFILYTIHKEELISRWLILGGGGFFCGHKVI